MMFSCRVLWVQTQTRIWLGEVLDARLDEDLPISDLLQDGEILFEVSKVLWNLLLTKKELRHLKQKFRPFGSKKIIGRYRAYSNIDSFLKICKLLGLSGIDLFSPSDVVEKKNTRKVCICIRALSKKARSKQLNVPDFNMVRYSVTMPTDMVGIIRRSLESPQCTVSSSSSYTSRKSSVIKSKQKKLYGHTNGDDGSGSDESDEAESRYMGENSISPAGKLNSGDRFISEQENSPETHSMSRYNLRNNTGNSNFNHALEKDASVVGDSTSSSIGENNYISEYLAFSDLMVHANNGDSPVIHDGEKNMFDFFLNLDPQGSGNRGSRNGPQGKLYDDEDIEVSSTASMSSVLGRLLNLEFDDQFDENETPSANIYSYESKEHEVERRSGDSILLTEQLKIDDSETQGDTILDNKSQSDVSSSCEIVSETSKRSDEEHHHVSIEARFHDQSAPLVVSNSTSIVEEGTSCFHVSDTDVSMAENGNEADKEHRHEIEDENISDQKKDSTTDTPPEKHRRRPVLETVVKGTAIAGVLFLLLHIRKMKGNNDSQETHRRPQSSKKNGIMFSFAKPQAGGVGNGSYPSDRIRL
ncbi:uncharacterized protein LOC127248913 isoform X2 [Andrographis paniculata]|uniref:uncharacterized protein LOC127248913 isoform X2 n=1 Tax=Andrographis paniculata TaxID=175694 RepID=UPI0021E93F20|nr:uncharacterized protein LOC127248913 isoform X2 [Andrographis paniculata]